MGVHLALSHGLGLRQQIEVCRLAGLPGKDAQSTLRGGKTCASPEGSQSKKLVEGDILAWSDFTRALGQGKKVINRATHRPRDGRSKVSDMPLGIQLGLKRKDVPVLPAWVLAYDIIISH